MGQECNGQFRSLGQEVGAHNMHTILLFVGVILILALAFALLPSLLSLVSALVWLLVVVPLVGTVIGMSLAFVIKRLLLPQGSPYRKSPAITTGCVAAGWLVVLLSSC